MMKLLSILKFFSLCLLIFSGVFPGKVYGQIKQSSIIFNDDLYALASGKTANLVPIPNDEVRVTVVAFNQDKEPIEFQNLRDSAISISFWFRPQNIDEHAGTLFGETGIYYFRYLPNRQLQFNLRNIKDVNTSGFVSEDQWQHAGFTLRNDGALSVYFNGDLVLKDTIPPDWWQSKGDFVIGKDLFNVCAEGRFDALRIWNKGISDEEMHDSYLQTMLIPDLNYGLQAYLPLHDKLIDLSGSGKTIEEAEYIEFRTDSSNRNAAFFSGPESYLKLSGFDFDKQKTIALWIKPDRKNHLIALIGNSDFSLRLLSKTNRLWYNVPMMFVIRAGYKKIITDDWMHVAISVNYHHKISFYINGELMESQVIGDQTGKEDFILLGRSMWGETYQGYMSELAIWDRSLSEKEIADVYNGKLNIAIKPQQGKLPFVLVGISILFLMIIILIMTFRNRSLKKQLSSPLSPEDYILPKKNAIYFFNSFKAFDNEGKDISGDFTPTLIRLFALITLYPKVFNRSINSAQISDILWANDDIAQQKNNRNSNIHRLRNIIKQIEGLSLVFKNREWTIIASDDMFIDIIAYRAILDKEHIQIPFTSFRLDKCLYTEGFDRIIPPFNDNCLHLISDACALSYEKQNVRRLSALSELWLTIDSLSDKALKYQIHSFMKLERKQNALQAYNAFAKNYLTLLDDKYPKSFEELFKG